MNNRNIAAVLGFIALVFATGFSFYGTLINLINEAERPTYHSEMLGCCLVLWVFVFIVFIYNKINKH